MSNTSKMLSCKGSYCPFDAALQSEYHAPHLQFLSKPGGTCFVLLTQRIALSRLALFCLVWPKINHSHTYSWPLATLVVIGLHNVFGEYCICAKCEIYVHIYSKSWYVENYQNPRQTKTRQYQARQDKTWRRPDEKVSTGFEKYCTYVCIVLRQINPLRAKFVRVNINMYLHFMSFIHINMAQVLKILPQIR